MQFGIASDHAGLELKSKIISFIQNPANESAYKIVDYGPHEDASVDYPDYAEKLSKQLMNKSIDAGILICGSGIGMSIVANKFKGVRAALVYSIESARLTKQHNNSNILCLAARLFDDDSNLSFLEAWLEAEYEAGRHEERLNKIRKIEE